MAKLFASEAATRACNGALQVHGGLRLRARVRRRAPSARRQALRDRRGDQRGSAHGHREAPPGALGVAGLAACERARGRIRDERALRAPGSGAPRPGAPWPRESDAPRAFRGAESHGRRRASDHARSLSVPFARGHAASSARSLLSSLRPGARSPEPGATLFFTARSPEPSLSSRPRARSPRLLHGPEPGAPLFVHARKRRSREPRADNLVPQRTPARRCRTSCAWSYARNIDTRGDHPYRRRWTWEIVARSAKRPGGVEVRRVDVPRAIRAHDRREGAHERPRALSRRARGRRRATDRPDQRPRPLPRRVHARRVDGVRGAAREAAAVRSRGAEAEAHLRLGRRRMRDRRRRAHPRSRRRFATTRTSRRTCSGPARAATPSSGTRTSGQKHFETTDDERRDMAAPPGGARAMSNLQLALPGAPADELRRVGLARRLRRGEPT